MCLGGVGVSQHGFRAETSRQSRRLGRDDGRLVAALGRLLRLGLGRKFRLRFLQLDDSPVSVPGLGVGRFRALLKDRG